MAMDGGSQAVKELQVIKEVDGISNAVTGLEKVIEDFCGRLTLIKYSEPETAKDNVANTSIPSVCPLAERLRSYKWRLEDLQKRITQEMRILQL